MIHVISEKFEINVCLMDYRNLRNNQVCYFVILEDSLINDLLKFATVARGSKWLEMGKIQYFFTDSVCHLI